jgi:GNAT superfamily N-acetyltransferase
MTTAVSINIREAELGDSEVIARFNVALARESEGLALDPAVVRQGVKALLGDRRKGIYFVAGAVGAVIGQVLITTEWSDWRNGDIWWLQSVYVQEEFRRRGVFKMLLAHVLEQARRQRQVCSVRLYMDADNATARQAYRRLGMKQTKYVVFETEVEESRDLPAQAGPETPGH